MYRKYRTGDLPDIQIKFSELIAPLQAVAQVGSKYVTRFKLLTVDPWVKESRQFNAVASVKWTVLLTGSQILAWIPNHKYTFLFSKIFWYSYFQYIKRHIHYNKSLCVKCWSFSLFCCSVTALLLSSYSVRFFEVYSLRLKRNCQRGRQWMWHRISCQLWITWCPHQHSSSLHSSQVFRFVLYTLGLVNTLWTFAVMAKYIIFQCAV